MPVKILTDSTSYINKRLREELDIRVISMNVKFDDESFKETDIDNESFYRKMEQKGIPMSSQPDIGEFKEEMTRAVEQGHSLLCIFVSSDMSGTYSTAFMIRDMVLEEYRDAQIEIMDSRVNCMQLGFAAIVAARAAKEGKSLQEVKAAAEENIKRSRFLFIPDNLQYLKKGGRIGGAGALLGGLLKIVPILTVDGGKTSITAKVRTKKNAAAAMVERVAREIKDYGTGEIAIHHIKCLDEARQLVDSVKKALNMNMDIPICDIGPVIGLHVGPGAIGIVYYTERPMR
ncbi:MAG: DegV family protein [Bacillota bacterium]|nr:DegV family protein [Bacillota bacterium]